MGGRIEVSFEQLDSCAGDIDVNAKDIKTELDELKDRVSKVTAQWEGSTSTEYQSKQKQWDDSAADLQEVLAQIAIAVRDAADAYREAERRNTSRWG